MSDLYPLEGNASNLDEALKLNNPIEPTTTESFYTTLIKDVLKNVPALETVDIMKRLMPLIEAHSLDRAISELERVRSCFDYLQNAEEAAYIDPAYLVPRIEVLKLERSKTNG